MKRNRSTRIETQRRIDQVFDLLVAGHTTKEIHLYSDIEWKVSHRMVDKYIAAAKERLEELVNSEQEYQFGLSVSRLNNLYRQSYTENNLKDCLNIQKEINELFSLKSMFAKVEDTDQTIDLEFVEEKTLRFKKK